MKEDQIGFPLQESNIAVEIIQGWFDDSPVRHEYLGASSLQ